MEAMSIVVRKRTNIVQAAAESLPFGVAISDINGNITWANAEFARLSDCNAEDLIGKASPEPGKGTEVTALRGPDGEITGYWLTRRERDADDPYRSIFENAVEGIFRSSLEGKILTANLALARIGGYASVEEALHAITDLAHQVWVDADERSRFLQSLGEQGSILSYECQWKRKDGARIWVSLNCRIVEGAPGQAACIEGFVEDITARRYAEHRYRVIFNSASDAIFVFTVGQDGQPSQILEVNDSACRYLGYTREELLCMRFCDIAGPEVNLDVPALLQALRAQGRIRYEGSDVAKDGHRVAVDVTTHLVDLDGSPKLVSFVRDISQRKDAQKQYQEIFEGALEGIYRTSLEGKNLAANPALARMLGYDSTGELASTVTDAARQVWVDPNERAEFIRLLQKEGVVTGYECRLKRQDGTPIWVSLNNRMVYAPDGQPLYIDGFVEDITARRLMQDALRKSEEKFAKAYLSSPAIIAIFDLTHDSRLVDVNGAFEVATGYRHEEVIGRTPLELGLVDPAEQQESDKQFLATGRLRNFEHHFRKKNGETGTGLSSVEVIELDGRPYAISASIDITAQKKAEEAMTSLVTAIEHAEEPIVVTGLDGAIQYCNPAFEKVTGYSREEAIGQNPRILKSGKHSPEFYADLWKTVNSGKVWRGQLTNRKKNGSLYQEEATISPITDTSGRQTGFVAVKRDVTEQRQLEEQFRQAQKLESVARLAGGVAHDFNNLLTVINGYSGILLRAISPSDRLHRSYVEEIKKAGEHAATLTRQLLAFSRKQVIKPAVLDLNTTIEQSAAMLQRLIGEDIVLETHLGRSLGQVIADPDQLVQVIMNLAVNARDAMPDGGRLDIATSNVDLRAADSSRPDAIPGRYILLTVTDTGHGMDETIRQRIFEPFFTTKESGQGTGLGLSTVHGIIRQGGGWIDVSSEVGIGTSFKVYLPRADGMASVVGEANDTLGTAAGATILVVEDQDVVRSFIKTTLQQHGYHVIAAADGVEAVDLAKQYSGPIDLCLTDVVLPGINGKELSGRLKQLRPGLKVLFTSGYTADVIARRGVLDDGMEFIAKPFSSDALARKVADLLGVGPPKNSVE